jgi:hypothetical protein
MSDTDKYQGRSRQTPPRPSMRPAVRLICVTSTGVGIHERYHDRGGQRYPADGVSPADGKKRPRWCGWGFTPFPQREQLRKIWDRDQWPFVWPSGGAGAMRDHALGEVIFVYELQRAGARFGQFLAKCANIQRSRWWRRRRRAARERARQQEQNNPKHWTSRSGWSWLD